MVKMEAFDDSHLCTRLLKVDILITLVASFLSWHASLILKRHFYVTGHSYSVRGLQPWYGENGNV